MKSLCFNSWFQQGTICFLLLRGIQKNWHDQCADMCVGDGALCWALQHVLTNTGTWLLAQRQCPWQLCFHSWSLCAIGSCRSVLISAVLLLETIERPWVVSHKYVYMYLTIKRWNCEFWLGQLQSQCQVQWTQRCSGYNRSNLALYFKNIKENLKIS